MRAPAVLNGRRQARPVSEARSSIAPVVGPTLAGPEALDPASVVRLNTVFLALSMALAWAIIQLQASLVAITTETLTGQTTLAGVGPAVFLVASGLATLPAGRLMDRFGRVPGISLGFLVATVGAAVLFAAVGSRDLRLFFVGLAALGAGLGAVQLARAGAADMYPAERRASGIGRVLVGAAIGALISPIAFGPLLRERGAEAASLAAPWLVAATVTALGAGLIWAIRVDPLSVARWIRPETVSGPGRAQAALSPSRSLRTIFAQRGPRAALLAAVAAQIVMTTAMSLVSLEMRHHGHDLGSISVALAAHFVGMFGLSPVMGRLVDRIGRRRALVLGLVVLAAAVLAMALSSALFILMPVMFAVGLGWNVAYVAATALIADGTDPGERARALGAADLLALLGAAAGVVVGSAILGTHGLLLVVLLAAALALAPAAVLQRPFRAPPLPTSA
jgi:MFS family permease